MSFLKQDGLKWNFQNAGSSKKSDETPLNLTPSISKRAQDRFDKASTKPQALGKTVEKSAVKLMPVVKKDATNKFRAFKITSHR